MRNPAAAGPVFAVAGFGAGTVYFLWPNLSEGFGSKIDAGTKSKIDGDIKAGDGQALRLEFALALGLDRQPQPRDLTLTIDRRLQDFAAAQLGSSRGAVVAIDPTGNKTVTHRDIGN